MDMEEKKREEETPQEVVDWYVPRQGQEVTDCYVHSAPLPEVARPQMPTPKKKSRVGLWVFLGSMAALIIILVLATVLQEQPNSHGDTAEPGDGDASSIVDIFTEDGTSIPHYTGTRTAHLAVSATHGEELTPQAIYAKVNPATVMVVAVHGDTGAALGTGVIMTDDGYIITNAHVVADGTACWIALDTGFTYDAELVGYSAEEDLAVLRAVDAADLPVAEFGDSDAMVVGDTVYAIGNPLGVELRGTFTEGMVSAINRDVEVDGKIVTTIQTTAALNNGNSGGPLINCYGQVIGINTLKMSSTGALDEATVEGLGFALPVSAACYVVDALIANGTYDGAPMLGITVMTVFDDAGGTCCYVDTVDDRYDAYRAGVRAGDVIIMANGMPVSDIDDLMAARRGSLVGDTMDLTLMRDDEMIDVTITLMADMD